MAAGARSRGAPIAAAVVVAALGVTAFGCRDRAARSEVVMTTGAAAPQSSQPRGNVVIDGRRQQLIGVRAVPAERAMVGATIRTTGVVRYDESRQTDVNVKVEGWILDLDVDLTGQQVRQGQRLFTIYSPELIATQSEFVLAIRNRDRLQTSTFADSRDLAARLVDAGRERLILLGLSDEEIRGVEMRREPIQAIAVNAPATGIVVAKQAVRGMHVTAGQTLYTIADPSIVWVEADVYERDMSLVRVGQSATVVLDSYPGQNFAARAIYVYPTLDPQTRTGKVRFQFPNPGSRLKPGMFANVELRGPDASALTIPANAVLDAGAQQTVFIAQGDGVFTPRTIKTGRRTGDSVEVVAGLKEGEQVAASATFFLDSESQLRAGLQNYEGASTLDIAFRPLTDPPKAGDNVFEVTVKNQAGQPVADAEVSLQLFMAAMPAMNMPAMRNDVRLPSAGAGVYRGPGQVMMGGRWDATVTVSKDGQRLGSRQFAVVAQ